MVNYSWQIICRYVCFPREDYAGIYYAARCRIPSLVPYSQPDERSLSCQPGSVFGRCFLLLVQVTPRDCVHWLTAVIQLARQASNTCINGALRTTSIVARKAKSFAGKGSPSGDCCC